MMREWATVIAWENGIATLRCNQRSGCSGCQASATCGVSIMNKIKSNRVLEFKLPVKQPLSVGQKVEIGIGEANLLYSALLIYMVPLLGLFGGAGATHLLFGGNGAVIIGALLGGTAGFFVAKYLAVKLERKRFYQPVVLQIAIADDAY